jgi:hypothetical protein
MSTSKRLRMIPLALSALALLWGPLGVTQAGPSPRAFPYFEMHKVGVFNQGAGGLTPQEFDFSLLVQVGTFENPPTLTYPGPGSPQPIPPFFSTFYYLPQSFATQAALDAAYPAGTYTVTATNVNDGSTATKSVTFSRDYYPNAVPQLTSNTYQSLQGLNAGQDNVLSFNTFTPDPLAAHGYTLLTITDVATSTTPKVIELPANATDYTLAANSLAPHRDYLLDLYFVNTTATTDGRARTQYSEFYDTEVTFTTGPAVVVPEPGCLSLAGVALAASVLWRRRVPA